MGTHNIIFINYVNVIIFFIFRKICIKAVKYMPINHYTHHTNHTFIIIKI